MTIHKYHVNNKYVCYLIIFTLTFLTSCSDKEDTTSEKDSNQLRVRVSVGIDNYMGEATRGSGKQWENNDRIYVHSSAFSGVLTYDGSNWTISYKGDVSGNSNCELYYFENVTGQDGSNVSLDYKSAVYHDQNASMKNLGDEIIFLGHLAPNCSRIRIKAADGTKIKVSGLKVFSGYSLSTNECATKSMEELQFVTQNGYTPYIYLPSNGNNQEMIIKTIGNVYKRTLTDNQLGYGKSGYFLNPTKENLNGWEFVSEEPIEKWDGNIASSFAGGSGTMTDPYKIETGGQLLLMKNYSYKYFKLIANIDLDNKNWLPFEFSGQLDGCGFTIYNLYINRESDKLGLFSSLYGVIKNLTIKNVKIEAPQNQKIGVISGYSQKSQIVNCSVYFDETSIIKGDSFVGGLVGDMERECFLLNCSVSNDSNSEYSIVGNKKVGGLCGYAYIENNNVVDNCNVEVNINGCSEIGGIIGLATTPTAYYDGIVNSSYTGTMFGESYIGGIIGYSGRFLGIIACVSDVGINISKNYAGGILGGNDCYNTSNNTRIVACYSKGWIEPTNSSSVAHIGGIVGYSPKWCISVSLSYSCITSQSQNFDGISGTSEIGVNTSCSVVSSNKGKGNCRDITQYLHDGYMTEYDKYWNYNNTWTWEGEVNGEKVKVSCPKLYWEE